MSKSGPIRWGVIGCGQIAIDKSLPGLLASSNAKLVAIADLLEDRHQLGTELAKQNGISPNIYQDYKDLLEDESVDAVYIALPTGMHAEAVKAAATAKKAILCEKPLGRSAQEVKTMIDIAKENKVPLMTAYMSRFSDVFQKAVSLIKEEAIGKVTFVSAHFSYPCLDPYPPGKPGGWRWTDAEGGGPLLDIGVYLAFGIREILGERIATVAPLNCDTIAPPESAIPDTTAAWFKTNKGTPGTLITTFSHVALYMQFFGEKGNITITDNFYQTPGAKLECKGQTIDLVLDTRDDASLLHFDNYKREFEHFSDALIHSTPHQPSMDDVLSDALLLDALKNQIPPSALVTVPSPSEYNK